MDNPSTLPEAAFSAKRCVSVREPTTTFGAKSRKSDQRFGTKGLTFANLGPGDSCASRRVGETGKGKGIGGVLGLRNRLNSAFTLRIDITVTKWTGKQEDLCQVIPNVEYVGHEL